MPAARGSIAPVGNAGFWRRKADIGHESHCCELTAAFGRSGRYLLQSLRPFVYSRSQLVLFLQSVSFCQHLQGIAKRNKDGTAASAKAVEAARGAGPLAWAAWSYAHKAGASYAEASAKGRAPAKVCSGEQAGDRG